MIPVHQRCPACNTWFWGSDAIGQPCERCASIRQANWDVQYAIWRMDMWFKSYGTYRDIDEAVSKGELIPGREYPSRRARELTKEE